MNKNFNSPLLAGDLDPFEKNLVKMGMLRANMILGGMGGAIDPTNPFELPPWLDFQHEFFCMGYKAHFH